MKKLLAVLLTLALAICAAADAEENEWTDFADLHPEARAFDSIWVSDDGRVRIDAFCRDDGFEMIIEEMTGADSFNAWEYLMTYDDENHRLVCDCAGLKSVNRIADGEVAESHVEYEDGSAAFRLDAEGNLCWEDEKEATFRTAAFRRIGRFPDSYVCERAGLRIRYTGEDLFYSAVLDWADSAFQNWCWFLNGRYDPVTDTLPVEGIKLFYTYLDDASLDPNADMHETAVKAVFTVSEDRSLVCASDDKTIDGLVFERMWTDMWQWDY